MDNTQKQDDKDQPLLQLAKQLNLTDPEPEEYILTQEEESILVKNEIERLKQFVVWKMGSLAYTEPQIMQRLKEIEWDKEVDKEKLFSTANTNKHQNLWHQQQRVREKQEEEQKQKDLIERCTAKFMFKVMKWTSENKLGRKLIVHDHNKHLITTLCYFISRDSKFETELGYSFQKGLLIRGIAGLGKTHLVRCLEENELNPILILSMIEITDEIKMNGEFEIVYGKNKIIYLDDVGTEEPVVNHYGTKISFFKNYIELMYLKNQNKTFNHLIISTNNSFSEIEDKYGFRVRSRIREMFNIVDVKGEDMRK